MPSTTITIDANIVVRAVLPVGPALSKNAKDQSLTQFRFWHQNQIRITAPVILVPEVVSVIRRFVFERWITETEGHHIVQNVFRLGLEVMPADDELSQAALNWAGRLGQARAYDAFYLALAESMGAEFWTGDRRLYHQAQSLGLGWVKQA